MPDHSISARLRVAAGVLAGAESKAQADSRAQLAEALHELQLVVRMLIEATESLDRLRESVARHGDV